MKPPKISLLFVNEVMTNLTEGVLNVLNEIVNILIGLIVSVYILFRHIADAVVQLRDQKIKQGPYQHEQENQG